MDRLDRNALDRWITTDLRDYDNVDDCDNCDASGYVYVDNEDGEQEEEMCEVCDGLGYIKEQQKERDYDMENKDRDR